MVERIEGAGGRLALEIMPSAVISGIDGFKCLCDQLNTDTLGLNYDTGHAWAGHLLNRFWIKPIRLRRINA